ncbi:Endoglin antigen [Schistosoma japonicum]|uniref:Endoglin antigen n=1 Tax=Schistosoma japonicum TaxID=6182 RepID=A0A4Z2D3R8_SCHJA|nr:Endoglin antigen [Schistosoma japonicum]
MSGNYYILLLNMLIMLNADEFHVVSPGPCLQEGDAYCMRRVANSMCSIEKNECFCKSGYVSIQENYGITCKTLLTNLKCQVDSDCIHVINSACHPGAGYCACPGGTIYVSQDNACRQLTENNQNAFCLKCRQANGVCYVYSSELLNSYEFNRYQRYEYKNNVLMPINSHSNVMFEEIMKYSINEENYGCSCPHNTGMLASFSIHHLINVNHSHLQKLQLSTSTFNKLDENTTSLVQQLIQQHLPQWYFCKAMMVDIWEYCNDIDLLCRSKNARCIKTDNGTDLIQFSCQCLPGYIPVYQKHLNYYECYSFAFILKRQVSLIMAVHSCYDNNTGDLYTGYLTVVTNQEYRNHEVDLLFQFTCKTNNDVPHRVPGHVYESLIYESVNMASSH